MDVRSGNSSALIFENLASPPLIFSSVDSNEIN
jgi:hypothetical protein